jgi:hypothetical protein
MAEQTPNQIVQNTMGTPLVPFQLGNMSIKEKSNPDWGKQLAEDIWAKVNGGTSSYFWVRNAKWRNNRLYANGKIPMQKFMDLLEFNGKENYINILWNCIYVVNRVVVGLVGRWMERSEKISVVATDPLSVKQKQAEYEYLEFVIENRKQLEELQAMSGVQVLPQGDELPQDKDQLKLWKATGQHIPEEILYQMGINDIFSAEGWYDSLKEKMLHDSAETGFVATYTWMDAEGIIHVEWLKPENCFYSYSNFPDFRDTNWRGYMRSIKISELRKKYGKEFHPNNPLALTEEQLFQWALTAKEYQLYDNLTWNTQYNVTYLRPYDEWNVDALEFELRSVDTESYTVITTKKNKSTIIKKGRPEKKADNEEVIDDSKINIYRGVYCRTTQTVLEWGLKKNMIRPQDPKEIGNAEFSYSFFMVGNYDMTCLGIPEKIQEPADQMIIARLKIQQLVASMVPAGAAINWDAIQNIDYGLGEGNKSIDVVKMQQQTGKLYWRGKDAEGNPIPVPIIEMENSGFITQMQALMELYRFHYQVMKDELGEDPNLISQALQPRVTAGNVEVSQQQAEFSTDQYYRAYSWVMSDTARKVSCLLKDSVTYGSSVYRNIVNEKDIDGRIFGTKIQLLPDAVQIQKFEMMMQQSIQANPELLQFLDPFQLMRIAKEDVELGETLFRQSQKKLIIYQQQTAQQNQQATIEGQIASAQAAEKAKQDTESLKGDIDIKKAQISADAKNRDAIVTMVTSWLKPSTDGKVGEVPPEYKPIVNAVMDNIMVSSIAETEEQKQEILAQIQMARQQQMQPPPQEQQIQQQNIQQQPQEQMVA